MVERGGDGARAVAAATWPLAGSAHTVGITGAPGAGKSTLTNAMCAALRAVDRRVAVLAVDPSSPFTGGALLGDRVRMADHALDPGVFIRSMATRGHLGGLAVATPEAARVLDAAGFDPVLVETVGVGQVEVEVAGATATTVVVVNPGWGDAVQAAKAGLMEVADLFVINKADRPGAGETRRDIEGMLSMSPGRRPPQADSPPWRPPVVDTVATDGDGVDELLEAMESHRAWLADSGEGERRRRARVAAELRSVVAALVLERAVATAGGDGFERAVDSLLAGHGDPWSAAASLAAL